MCSSYFCCNEFPVRLGLCRKAGNRGRGFREKVGVCPSPNTPAAPTCTDIFWFASTNNNRNISQLFKTTLGVIIYLIPHSTQENFSQEAQVRKLITCNFINIKNITVYVFKRLKSISIACPNICVKLLLINF